MRAARVDRNQSEIVHALRKVGASVQHLHKVGEGCPDLLVGFRAENYLLECKTPDKASKLNKRQKRWHAEWRGNAHVVRSAQDAMQVIGVFLS